MKKIIFIVCLLYCICSSAFASPEMSFVYINGSNNNDRKMKTWYETGIEKIHPVLKKKFENSKDLKKYYKNESITVKEKPVIFFWGYNSKKDLDYVKSQLEITKAISSTGAYIVRNLIAQYLHDAIWVQKSHNMIPILDDLNDRIKLETNKGNDVVLYGYSAGTFVTYEYMFNKLRYINTSELINESNLDEDIKNFVKNNPANNTCLSAISANNGGLGAVSLKGDILINPNKDSFKQNYLKINDVTEMVCAPDKKVRGIVNYASPLVLFYSDIADTNYELNYYNKLMIKYILENDIFMLTVNFKEDPLGFPTSSNLTLKEIENILELPINNPSGIIYDNSSVWSKRFFPLAHTSYWSAKRTFSNAIVKTLAKGYRFNYDEKYQNKILKRHSKKSEL
ncbi:hypothetical protein IJ182_05195 [bacterium]|nr:hypothetical protein [bacterium]